MKKALLFSILTILFLFSITACQSEKTDNLSAKRTEFEKMDIAMPQVMVQCFAFSEAGDVYVLDWDGVLTRYASDGTVKKSVDMEELKDTNAMLCVGERLYLLKRNPWQLCEWDPASEKLETVISGLEIESMLVANFVTANGTLYYLDAGKLVELDIEEKTEKELDLPVTGVSAIYGAADGALYYCTSGQYECRLYRYDEKRTDRDKYDEDELICVLRNEKENDSIQAFVLEKGYLTFATLYGTELKVLLPKEEKEGLVRENVSLQLGTNMKCVAGNVLYYTGGMKVEDLGFGSFYIPEILLEKRQEVQGQDEPGDGNGPKNPQKDGLTGNIKISTNINTNNYNIDRVNECGNIRARFIGDNMNIETELMTGDDRIDIYILGCEGEIVRTLLETGYYVPLNDSEIIREYCSKCFDNIEEAVTAENGDIFALPITVATDLMWYVPENFKKYGLQESELDFFESYLDLSEKADRLGMSGITFYQYVLGMNLCKQYDYYYNNFWEGKVDYQTELFYDYFRKMWDGWSGDGPLYHPRLNGYKSDFLDFEDERFKKENVLFLTSSNLGIELELRSEEGWRLRGMPKLSEKCQEDFISVSCAIINPASKNKELAYAYLETIAANSGCIQDFERGFLFEDKSMYGDEYDFSIQAIQDIYDIVKNGVLDYGVTRYLYIIINDYQQGRYTMEEAIEQLQRKMEMYLNE